MSNICERERCSASSYSLQSKASASVCLWDINAKWDRPLIQVKITWSDSCTRK